MSALQPPSGFRSQVSGFPASYRPILGINFYVGPMAGLLERTAQGGLIVVPSAPVLVNLKADPTHRRAVEGADLAITDSGFMVLLWLVFQCERLIRISGLRYLRALLQEPTFQASGNSFWVMPTAEDAAANRAWLNTQGFSISESDCYVAPHYARTGPLEDPALLALLEAKRPQYVLINLGGGVQERLGWYLRQALQKPETGSLKPEGSTPDFPLSSALRPPSSVRCPPSYRPAIICTGAAIAFLSGRQANIPVWADRLMLGWLLRSFGNPRLFLPRYWQSLRLVPLLWKHGSKSVAL